MNKWNSYRPTFIDQSQVRSEMGKEAIKFGLIERSPARKCKGPTRNSLCMSCCNQTSIQIKMFSTEKNLV